MAMLPTLKINKEIENDQNNQLLKLLAKGKIFIISLLPTKDFTVRRGCEAGMMKMFEGKLFMRYIHA